MGNTFVWSDLHRNHDFVARTRGFANAAEQDAHIEAAWRRKVRPSDTVWLLGDLWVGGGMRDSLDWYASLPGTKRLVFGNHCPGHPMHRRSASHQRRYLEVFDAVFTHASLVVAGQRVLLNHFPYEGDHGDRDDRHVEWRPRDAGSWLIHGHVHDEWFVRGRQINVGVDVWPDGPASLKDLAGIINTVEPPAVTAAPEQASRTTNGMSVRLLKQGEVWVDALGQELPISTMTPSHAANTAAMLRRADIDEIWEVHAIISGQDPADCKGRPDMLSWLGNTPLLGALDDRAKVGQR